MSAADALPRAKVRRRRGERPLETIDVKLQVVTPLLGGATTPREVDGVDGIRAPSIRGQLRFFWRALRAHDYATPQDLFLAEGALWGRTTTHEEQEQGEGRSRVEIEVREVVCAQARQADEPVLQSAKGYAMWPLREERRTNTPAGYYREPGTSFRLVVRAEADAVAPVREALLAWIVFGGYGGRTRRGLGSLELRAVGEGSLALPEAPTREALARAFGRDIFARAPSPATHVPRFAGAALAVGSPVPEAERAWETALTVLREFRQGTSGGAGDRAREPGPKGGRRASVSNWPEADKVRHLAAHGQSGRWSHRPRYGPDPAWTRAELGLPIVGRFQTQGRDGSPLREPGPFEIRWEPASEARWPRDRLASPLVVKAMPLADGRFAPCLLWFERAYPPGRVVLYGPAGRVRNSEAPFGKLLGQGDNPLYSILAPSAAASAQGEAAGRPPTRGLRDAFFDWAEKRYGMKVIAR